MTLEETIEYIKNLCIERSEDIECNECRTKHSDVLAYLLELHAWREDRSLRSRSTARQWISASSVTGWNEVVRTASSLHRRTGNYDKERIKTGR